MATNIFRFDPVSGELGIYFSKKEAAANGNGPTFSTEDDLVALTEIGNTALVTLHNSLAEAPVKKFGSRIVAARRVMALLELKAAEVKAEQKANGKPAAAEKAPKAEKPAAAEKAPKAEKAEESTGRRGKQSRYAGMSLHAKRDVNPRRAGTHGFRSYEIILRKPGISLEAYMAAGGRGNDLQWDIDHDFVEAR